MQRLLFTANTDELNRQNIICPVDVLANSIEAAFDAADPSVGFGGFPTHVSHDWCRPIGWNVPLGIHLESGVARQMGEHILPESFDERHLISEEQRRYVDRITHTKCAPLIHALAQRAGRDAEGAVPAYVAGAAGLHKVGLAAALYPKYFDAATGLVDKDGLVDYRTLRAQCKEIQPGIFHDASRDLLLFAHPYLRRSLSRLNTLNTDILKVLDDFARTRTDLSVRLKLDPDVVGHPDVKMPVELEYWRGPHFSDNVADIPSGVAEHKTSENTRFFEGIDRTQFWWKPEDDGRRTFEAEEIRDEPSLGVSDEFFGCRYVHSEYSPAENAITHFDGAIRGYATDVMLHRLDRSIDRAGKHANYTKLFRVDGPLAVGVWKNAVVEYFRGNDLVPEYFGTPAQATKPIDGDQAAPEMSLVPASGQVMVGYLDRNWLPPPQLPTILPLQHVSVLHETATIIDALPGAVANVFEDIKGFVDCVNVTYADGLLNLPFVVLPDQDSATEHMRSIASNLVPAALLEHQKIVALALTFAWPMPRYWVLLSFIGDVQTVADKLAYVLEVANPHLPPSEWIASLKVPFSDKSPSGAAASRLNVCAPALLRFKHAQSKAQFYVPEGHPQYESFKRMAS